MRHNLSRNQQSSNHMNSVNPMSKRRAAVKKTVPQTQPCKRTASIIKTRLSRRCILQNEATVRQRLRLTTVEPLPMKLFPNWWITWSCRFALCTRQAVAFCTQCRRRNQMFHWLCYVIPVSTSLGVCNEVTGLFVPLHFRSREWKDHGENWYTVTLPFYCYNRSQDTPTRGYPETGNAHDI